jgi:outer membrane protein OmpA-like peptidoglycan-associated protein
VSEANTSWDELSQGVDRAACERHKFIVPRTTAHVLTLDDCAFHAASPVLLPTPLNPKRVEGGVVTGLSVIAQALNYAGAHSDQKLSVLAHCAPLGSHASEMGLSNLRAQNVLAYLQGDRDAWAESCAAHLADDVATVRDWAKRVCAVSWPAHGGDVDDWKAAFDLYDQQLARSMKVDDLSAARAKLRFGDPESLGCGAFWPRNGGFRPAPEENAVVAVDTGRASARDSRVDLLFAEPDVRLPAQPKDRAAGALIYRDQRYVLRDAIVPEPEPIATCVRMTGMYFDTNKSFLLPSALVGMAKLVSLYAENPRGDLLVVGHTDTTGDPDYNATLSLERAKSVVAFLQDDSDAWLKSYDSGTPEKKRWGTGEDRMMFETVTKQPMTVKSVKAYQSANGLEDDGKVGPNTRKVLITHYMASDGTSLPAGVTPVAHGCGESFPLVETGDGVDQAENRRVELFLFEPKLDPAPTGETSKAGTPEYPAWRARVVRQYDLDQDFGHDLMFALRCNRDVDPQYETELVVFDGETEIARLKYGDAGVVDDVERGIRNYRFSGLPVGRYDIRAEFGEQKMWIALGVEVADDGIALGPDQELLATNEDLEPTEGLMIAQVDSAPTATDGVSC